MTTHNKAIRRTILSIVNSSGAGHIGAAFSFVDIVDAIYSLVDVEKIKRRDPDRDRVILSKGHGVSALYATMHHYGLLSLEQVNTYFKNGSLLEGHASHHVPGVEHSTGALGHGLPVALGMAIGLRAKRLGGRVFTIVGDGELHEGSNWEAFMQAGHLGLANFHVFIDRNGLSQIGEVHKCCDVEPLRSKLESFKFEVSEVDGHDKAAILAALQNLTKSNKPTALICRTVKGRGVSFMENNNLWHYRCPKGPEYETAVRELAE